MARPLQNKVNRDDVYREVAKEIELSPNGEAEISSSNLADKFGVQGPTMDYHLNVLVKNGALILLDKRGKYNKKIFKLPSDTNVIESKNDTKADVHIPFQSEESKEKFNNFIEQYKKKSKSKNNEAAESKEEQKDAVQENKTIEQQEDELIADNPGKYLTSVFTPVQTEEVEEPNKVKEPEEVKEIEVSEVKESTPAHTVDAANFEIKELTLDQKIEKFLDKTNQIHNAEELLSHQDKEILSVMNETIQQNMVYLKDLSEQLTTVNNKQLIQHLIDDRNRLNSEVEKLQKELEEARKQSQQTVEKYEIDPNRVRFMQQMIFDTLDNYVNQQNHALALGRIPFRNKISKEVNDLVKYTLRLEK
ncbi:ArsR family transcriptional regulator [Bacillus thuringiensis]|uniref:ArsR family transcriptional regulator n=1 Tax=Bacillus cereus group TaxID=86661 RepID=UPI0012989F03|nr:MULTISPECIES: ArsR family transcriptional regulator [Bacillus cereus group]MDR5047852.1 ArsR family transcriptional regulator [Bacillus thuringiensis]MEB9419944.1 ArsR family transcriptional regulator [Bacillus cereus]MRD18520.1 ArsR family transcriptional regulator [Bacillus thuringiensis]